jgi:ribonuclease Z
VQDLGLNDPSGNGIIPVLSESMHYRKTGAYITTGTWQIGGDEAWLDYQTYAIAQLAFFWLTWGRNISSSQNGRKMCESLGLEYLKTIDVYHGCRCYGVTFKHKDGWSVTSVILFAPL